MVHWRDLKMTERNVMLWSSWSEVSLCLCSLVPVFSCHELRPKPEHVQPHWWPMHPGAAGALGEEAKLCWPGARPDRAALLWAAGAGHHGQWNPPTWNLSTLCEGSEITWSHGLLLLGHRHIKLMQAAISVMVFHCVIIFIFLLHHTRVYSCVWYPLSHRSGF